MNYERKLALIVAYYLSKYDTAALAELGYVSFRQAYEDVGSRLGVKASSIKNMRDEFDPLHDNDRAGWHQRPLRPSRARVVEALSNMSEASLRSIVLDIIHSETFRNSGTLNRIVTALDDSSERRSKTDSSYSPRGITGKKAEELFYTWFQNGRTPWTGHLLDHREHGQGYDYLLVTPLGERLYLEVKGLAADTGGILLTDKEWHTAQLRRENYIIVVLSDLETSPRLSIIYDPTATLKPSRNLSVSVVVSWSVPSSQLS